MAPPSEPAQSESTEGNPTTPDPISQYAFTTQALLIAALVLAFPILQFLGLGMQAPAIVAPWALAIVLLWMPRFRHLGFVIAWSTAMLVMTLLAPFAAGGFLLAGFMATDAEWGAIVLTLVLTGLLVGVVVQSSRAMRRFSPDRKFQWEWAVASVGIIAFLGILSATVTPLDERARFTSRKVTPIEVNHANAEGNIMKIARCAARHAELSPQQGLPHSLQELSSGAAPCLNDAVASGELDGYRYHYYPLLPDANGVVRGYEACAEPIEYDTTRTMTVVIDESGKSPTKTSAPDGSASGKTCAEAWSYPWRAVRFCAAQYASLNPQRGYPATMSDIGFTGNGCLDRRLEGPDELQDRINTWNWNGRIRVTYIAGEPDAAGRISSYQAHVHYSEADSRNKIVDEYGAAQQARELYEKACAASEPKACGALADRVRRTQPAKAHRLDLMACAGAPNDEPRCKPLW